MPQDDRVTARDIIETIVEAMRKGTEPLVDTALAPSHYQVHLNTPDYERLAGIFARIIEETKRALDRELERQNAGPTLWRRLKGQRGGGERVVYESADGDWYITFHERADEDLEGGSFDVSFELALPTKSDASGSKTKVVTLRRTAEGSTRKVSEVIEPRPPAAEGAAEFAGPGRPRSASGGQPPSTYATLSYEDERGRQRYHMTKNQIVIGRGGVDYWVDIRLDTSEDVSREHLRLRRDPQTGRFFVKDMSTYGTTIDGEKIESSIEVVDGIKQDRNAEVELPGRARIGLAGVLYIDFEAVGGE